MAEPADGRPHRGHYWEPLNIDAGGGYAEMARYVSVGTLDRFALSVERPSGSSEETDSRVVAELFALLQGRRYRFREEDWVPHEGQRIRHVALIASEGGNCADLATSFAAMCLRSKVAPLLAVTSDDSHAFVIARRGWFARRDENLAFELDGASLEDVGVLRVDEPAGLLRAVDDGGLIPVDCVAATDSDITFKGASERCGDYIRPGLHLIDVAYLHENTRFGPEEPPDDTAIILRYPQLPKVAVELFAAQRKLADGLAQLRGRVYAIIAEPGQGKSTVARRLVDEAQNDSGWFLNASDPQALIDSLADAELAQAGLPRTELERPDRESYALAGKRRLESNPAPWIVVLDNADGDPKLLMKYMPRPGRGQAVVVTTTNDEWERYLGADQPRLGRVTAREVSKRLGGKQVKVRLIAGRALMVEAFAKLLVAEPNLEPTALEQAAPREGRMPAELEGPAAFWQVLRSRPWFTEKHRQVSAIAAHLPPDHLPVTLVEQLALAGAGTVAELSARGLFAVEGRAERARLHRLFGMTIRWSLEHEATKSAPARSLLDSVAVSIATSEQACKLLADHGDREGVKLLLERVAQALERSRPKPGIRDALRGLAAVLELRGDTAGSAEAYRLLLPMLANSREDRQLRAEYHHAEARLAYRERKDEERLLRDGLEHAGKAHEIATALDDEDNVGRYLAMQGLVLKELARFPRPGETSLALSVAALKLLEEAHKIRDKRLGPIKHSHPEWARSYFNLAGARLPLAQAQPRQAKRHLDRAAKIYTEVAELRAELFGTKVHAQIAPCIQGLGLVAYYRAILVAGSEKERSDQLREATHRLAEALADWEEIEGPLDGADAAKVSGYMLKVALARKAHRQLAYKPNPDRDSAPKLSGWAAPLVTEAVQELARRHEVK